MKICNRCKIENIDAARFCKHCGSDDLYDPDFEIKEVKRKAEVKKNMRYFFICWLLIGIVIFGNLAYQFYLPLQYEKQCKNGDMAKCELLLENKPNSWKNLSSAQRENKINNIKEKLCENGKNEYCYDVALNFINNYDYDKAEIYAKKVCDYSKNDCRYLAEKFFLNNHKTIANSLYEINCKNKDEKSCKILCDTKNKSYCKSSDTDTQKSNFVSNQQENKQIEPEQKPVISQNLNINQQKTQKEILLGKYLDDTKNVSETELKKLHDLLEESGAAYELAYASHIEYILADRLINKVYQEIIRQCVGDDCKNKFKEMQLAWISFKEIKADLATYSSYGASGYNLDWLYYYTLAEITKEQINFLATQDAIKIKNYDLLKAQEITNLLSERFEKADKDLNTAYRKALKQCEIYHDAILETYKHVEPNYMQNCKSELKKMQLGWIKFRDKRAEVAKFYFYNDGNMNIYDLESNGLVELIKITEEQTKFLEKF